MNKKENDSDKKFYILDASAFIGGFDSFKMINYTVSEITEEIKDLKSKMNLNQAIEENKLFIKEPSSESIQLLENEISKSGDILRLSLADKKLLALAIELSNETKDIEVVSDDYSIQNVLEILKIPYRSVLTEGIKGIYNWKKICQGCKKEYSNSYKLDDCEICGSKIFKKRIKKE